MATTWDEPWHRQVVANADSLVLVEVLSVKGGVAHVRALKQLAGEATPAEFDVAVIDALELTSTNSASHDEHEIGLIAGSKAYLLPKHDKQAWTLLTPTAGIDQVQPGDAVAATYRISAHQALQGTADYELVQSCVFRQLHGGQCDVTTLQAQLDKPLRANPAALSEDATQKEQDMFFRQHVALESAYLLKRSLPLKELEPFLQSGFFHTQISAVRALAASQDQGRNARLVEFIKDESRLPVAQAIAVVMAKELGDQALIAEIKTLAPKASDADSHLPIALMDPRIGTAFPPSVKAAIEEL